MNSRIIVLTVLLFLPGCLTSSGTPRDLIQYRYGVILEQIGQASRSALGELRSAASDASLNGHLMNMQRFSMPESQRLEGPDISRQDIEATAQLAEGISVYGHMLASDQFRAELSLSWVGPALQIAGLASPTTTAAIATLTTLLNADDGALFQRRAALPKPLNVLADQLAPEGTGLAARYALAVELLDLSLLDTGFGTTPALETSKLEALSALRRHKENILYLDSLSALLSQIAELPYAVNQAQLDVFMTEIATLRASHLSKLDAF